MNLLLLHGNGGAAARFRLLLDQIGRSGVNVRPVIPELPGFEGRDLPLAEDYWAVFVEALQKTVLQQPEDSWVFYGHGIGGSFLLEWAARNWELGNGKTAKPQQVILHGCIGASLEYRFFPKLMKPLLFRKFIHWLIYQPWLRKRWERKLFLFPEEIPLDIRDQFFEDYRRCTAFPILFDLINAHWYRQVQQRVANQPFHFVWGQKERVVAAKHLHYWQRDFPNATFDIIPEWDHFPMLDQPQAFFDYLMNQIEIK